MFRAMSNPASPSSVSCLVSLSVWPGCSSVWPGCPSVCLVDRVVVIETGRHHARQLHDDLLASLHEAAAAGILCHVTVVAGRQCVSKYFFLATSSSVSSPDINAALLDGGHLQWRGSCHDS